MNSLWSLVLALLVLWTTDALSPRLYGVNYSLKKGPDWDPNRCKNREQVAVDLRQLKNEVTDRVRLFSVGDCNTAAIVLDVAREVGMGVWLGLWVGPNQTAFTEERQRLLELLTDTSGLYDFTNVIGIHVSSEAIYREEITADEAIALRNVIRGDMDAAGWDTIPVTVSDIIDTNLIHPELTRLDPRVVTFNQFPFWENTVNITTAAEYMSFRVAMIEEQNTDFDRQIIITETGWADAGSNKDANVANPQSMAQWMADFTCLANARGWLYFWFDAYDSDWRRIQENLPNDVEGHFGIYHANGTMKAILRNLVIDCNGDAPNVAEPTPATFRPTASPVASPEPTTETAVPTSEPTMMEDPPTTPPIDWIVATPTSTPVAVEDTVISNAPVTPSPIAPSSAAPQSAAPVNAVPMPVTAAPQQPTTLAPVVMTVVPPTSPPFTAAVTIPAAPAQVVVSNNANAQCQENAACAARNLTGQCCPTLDAWDLACCGDGTVQELCQGNSKCSDLELTGACCPTMDGKYLDCCEVVPDACLVNGTNSAECQRYSAVQYKLDMETRSGSVSLTGLSSATAFLLVALFF